VAPDPVAWLLIEPGWEVAGKDGAKLGLVEDVAGDESSDIFSGLSVRAGLVKGKRFVPAERVTEIVEGRITVDVDANEFERLPENQTG
jgi:uncharacterized protein YrrD